MTRAWVAGIVLAALSVLRAQEAPKASEGSLTIEEVLSFSKQGMTEEFIINQVKRNAKPFDLNSDEIAYLRDMGISDRVIGYLRNPSQPYSPPVAPSPPIAGGAPHLRRKPPAGNPPVPGLSSRRPARTRRPHVPGAMASRDCSSTPICEIVERKVCLYLRYCLAAIHTAFSVTRGATRP